MLRKTRPFLCNYVDEIHDLSTKESLDLRRFLTGNLILSKKSFSEKPVLIITNKYDIEADLIGIHLLKRGVDYVRLNIDEILEHVRVNFSISKDSEPKLLYDIEGNSLEPSTISVVFLRNYDLSAIEFGTNTLDYIYSIQQWESALGSLENNLSCEWLNSRQSNFLADDRIEQLSRAHKLGFEIPSTLITNDPGSARDFYKLHEGNIIIKCLYHHRIDVQGKAYSIYTRKVTKEDLENFDSLVSGPCILQTQVKKEYELRVTLVEDSIYPVRIKTPREPAGDDIHRYRLSELPKEIIRLPECVEEKCRKLISSFNLKYGTIDFLIDGNNDITFLEVNARGDWHWIERQTGLLITESMVNLIEKYRGTK